MNLNTFLIQIRGIGPRFITKLKKLKIETVRDLLWHFPVRYEDFSKIYKIDELIPHQEATVQGVIQEITGRRAWRRNLYLVEALISDDSGSIRAVWFNQPYIKNILRPGKLANFSGKVTASSDDLYLSNPTYELINEHFHHETRHTGRIVPIYPETKGLTSKGFRYLIQPILENIEPIIEIIPEEIWERQGLPEINTALRHIHFPDDFNDALTAKKRFAFEDLFFLQLFNINERLKLAKEKALAIPTDIEEIKKLIATLPFELTISQKKTLWEIVKDLEKSHPMNRLLQGDVGSGKTIIAALAALTVARNGEQTAFMAPTEILARQHYQTLTKFFPQFDNGIALLTSSESKISYGHNLETTLSKPRLINQITSGKIKIIVGTHALIQKGVAFHNLALVIVDEQHRFGVRQRATLVKDTHTVPHLLSMSATPIPRTLSLTLFGDLDLSLITELPKDRKPIVTKIVSSVNRDKTYDFIREQIKKGRQAFVICPHIQPPTDDPQFDEAEFLKLDLKNVTEEYHKLSHTIFPDLNVAMLHGKLKPKEKERIMREFLEKKFGVLVATSVIEVGVDVPNATIMMIEGADRFGLAQIYQFRGRVGRGEHQSYCFLFTDSSSKTTQSRLKSIIEAKNGFELAEKDLMLRGPGEFLGEAQTGIPDLAMKAIQNPELVKNAREAASSIIKTDPSLKRHSLIKERIEEFKKRVHLE
ncbi:ATP-dependent DNA helicase RecG [Candidatus Jorgensenbacteria bacterium]|nr:ATP-dependent DNA helicase RecG [Candidatus Jorgensenbacteria bacterium]